MKNSSDEDLIKRYGEGDIDAFSILYSRHKGGLYRYLLRQIKDESTAEDVFQEVWSAVIKAAKSYEDKAKFTTWLYTLARNKVIDRARHLKVVEAFADKDIQHTDEGGEQFLLRHRQKVALKICLDKLPTVQLDCFLLKEEANLSIKEIAKVVDANAEAAKSRIRYAYRNLRECLTISLGESSS